MAEKQKTINRIYCLCPGIKWDNPTTGGLLYNYILIDALKKHYGAETVIPLDLMGVCQTSSWGKLRVLANVKYVLFFLRTKFNKFDLILVDSRANSLLLFPLLFLRFFSSVSIGLTVFHIYFHLSGRQGVSRVIEKCCEKMFIRCASFIITISRSTLQGITQLSGRKEFGDIPIWIIPPGLKTVDNAVVRREVKGASRKCNILYVGNCEDSRKGLVYLIRAVSNLRHSHFKLFLVGKYNKMSSSHKSLTLCIADNNVAEKVQFLGRISDEKLDELYRKADIFAFPSLWEGYGIVLAEAMTYGLPVVSTNVSAIPEIVSNGENGILVNPGNVKQLTEALDELMGNDNLRREMGEKSIEIANSFKNWDEVGKVLVKKIELFLDQKTVEIT
ncbi:MAG: glycosyltransferase family 4 protein [Desulfocapsa sp.]|nr:glycosyltransferase family 4 protein [Desulfocapsa sp.]